MNSLLLTLGVTILLASFIPSSDAVKSCYSGSQDLTASSSTAPAQATCGDTFIFCYVNKLFLLIKKIFILNNFLFFYRNPLKQVLKPPVLKKVAPMHVRKNILKAMASK